MIEKQILLDYTQADMSDCLVGLGEPAFRGRQIFCWLHKGVPFCGMRNLPNQLRKKLEERFVDIPMGLHAAFRSSEDDTVKFLFACGDGQLIESVLMNHHYGYTLCVSTQIGCRMRCAFCASSVNGFIRNLSAGEMLSQVLLANRYLGNKARVGHVVLMGSGEPLDNYAQTIRFIRLLNDVNGLGISFRNVSLSTCGLIPFITKLAEEEMPITLSISLHAPNDSIRTQIMPIARGYPILDLIKAARAYVKRTGRRVVFEYALINGMNSQPSHARELAGLIKGMQCHVNLIPLNRIEESVYTTAGNEAVRTFLRTLIRYNVSVTCRKEMGADINGACGQLRHQYLKNGMKVDRMLTGRSMQDTIETIG